MNIDDSPVATFNQWLADATAYPDILEPTAMCLSTVDANGVPSSRTVLLKEHGEDGFVFYTNLESRKSREIQQRPDVALCFYWQPLDRQVRITGRASLVDDAKADAYFASRVREKQLGAWASLQSSPLPSRDALDVRIEEMRQTFDGKTVPRPPYWSGWCVVPHHIELWEQREFRLHNRAVFTRNADNTGWKEGEYLYP